MKTKAGKIAINSLALYLNMFMTMAVTLLGTRFVLQALGEEQYAIYTLVANNIVALFSFLNVAMAGASQRYMSFFMGTGKQDEVNNVFYNSFFIHSAIAILVVALLLAVGIPAIKYWLSIPVAMHTDAIIVLLCMIGSVVFLILSVPYEAAMNAHEDIHAIAAINILEALCKLGAATIILFTNDYGLPLYALFIMCSSMISFLCKRGYGRKKYTETHFSMHAINDRTLLKQMTSYAGWNLIGNGCSITRYQGTAIILNSFFGLIYNAGYGISQQLNGFLLFFANSAVRPMRPHIIKSEGAGYHHLAIEYSLSTSRITSLLLAAVVIPLYINMPFILDIWLGEIPTGSLEFCRGFLIITLIGQFTIGQQIALESVGKIKNQHIILGAMHLLPIIVSVILFANGMPYRYIIYCIITEEIICLAIRTLIAKKDAGMPVTPFITSHLVPCTITLVITFIISSYASSCFIGPIARLLTSTICSTLSIGVLAFALCLTKWEKEKIYSVLHFKRSE